MARGDASTARGWDYPDDTSFTINGADAITDAQDRAAAALTAIEGMFGTVGTAVASAATKAAALEALGIYVQGTDPGHSSGQFRMWISWS